MTRIAIETNSQIIKRGLQNILKDYEVLDFYESTREDFDLLIFEDKNLENRREEKIRIVGDRDLPLNIDYSLLSLKSSEEEILEAVDKTLRGYVYIEESLKEAKRNRSKKFDKIKTLTRREKYLLEEIIAGKTNKDISKEIYISEKTIKNNLTALYKKLEVSGRREIINNYSGI
ncbi:LuxR C-terminal-related transcriptional regulator [uncultured Peptoniphilus sp.]|uniref:LuxR C-terminal-related transcriptional regulator n=1 Tax=uncultured Peptoniphilus sp. TaxID=254354 RepID=UPI0026030CFD|nr:LuxR C-terminal-related transcriptional regulator [uncultured Peptoniphilus sp.]